MTQGTRPQGKTTVAPDVLVSIARLTALSVAGVHRMTEVPANVAHIFKSRRQDGVLIAIDGDIVSADLYLIMNSDVNVREVSKIVQNHVARAISEMVGLDVGTINIHVEDIHYNS